jgi:hypothetical protein
MHEYRSTFGETGSPGKIEVDPAADRSIITCDWPVFPLAGLIGNERFGREVTKTTTTFEHHRHGDVDRPDVDSSDCGI